MAARYQRIPPANPGGGDSLNIVAVTGPGETTAAIAITKENTKTETSESVGKFEAEWTVHHSNLGKCLAGNR